MERLHGVARLPGHSAHDNFISILRDKFRNAAKQYQQRTRGPERGFVPASPLPEAYALLSIGLHQREAHESDALPTNSGDADPSPQPRIPATAGIPQPARFYSPHSNPAPSLPRAARTVLLRKARISHRTDPHVVTQRQPGKGATCFLDSPIAETTSAST